MLCLLHPCPRMALALAAGPWLLCCLCVCVCDLPAISHIMPPLKLFSLFTALAAPAAGGADNLKKWKLPQGDFLHNFLQQQRVG